MILPKKKILKNILNVIHLMVILAAGIEGDQEHPFPHTPR
jgi:hypothetical protein